MNTPKSAPRVGFVVLSWNGGEILKTCLDSLETQANQDFVVCLIDNGSTDNTGDVFAAAPLPRKISIVNTLNRGFAPAVNQGVNTLLHTYPQLDYIVLLNNDVTLHQKWLSTMLRVMDKETNIGFAQGENYTDSSYKTYECTGIYMEEGFIPRQKTTLDESPQAVGPNAAALMMRRSFVEDMQYNGDLLDGTFFAYVEDVDLLLRAYLKGWRHMLIKGAKAVHSGSATGNRISTKKMYWGSRNLVWLVVKNVPLPVLLRKSKKILVSRLADIEFLARTNPKLMHAYVRGLLVGIVTSPLYLLKRRTILSTRHRSDEELIAILTPSNPPLTNPVKALKRKVLS